MGRTAAVALACLACLPATALGSAQSIRPSQTLQGRLVHGNASTSRGRKGRFVVPLRTRVSPSVYAQFKREAAARASARAAVAAFGSAEPVSAANAAVAGLLNVAGMSAAGQIAAFPGAPSPEDGAPPDTTGAIGPNYYVEFTNGGIAAFSRSNLSMVGSSADLATFVGDTTGPGSACDPQIKYDPVTSRWFYVALDCANTAPTTNDQFYVGFSKTSDPTNFSTGPTGGWCGYSYATVSSLEDYPKLGVDGTHIMIGVNEYDDSMANGNFQDSPIYAGLEPPSGTITTCPAKPTLTKFGDSGTPLATSVGNPAFTPEPATVAGAATGGYVVSADLDSSGTSGANIMVWQVTNSGSTLNLTALGAPAVPAYSVPANIPQPGSSDTLDALDGRLTNAIAAVDPTVGQEVVWTEHTISSGPGTLVRWYEIVPGASPTARQVGSVTDPGGWAFNGAIAPTSSGGAVINYNAGGPSQLVSIKAQARIPSAALSTMSSPITLGSSTSIDADFTCPSQATAPPIPPSCRWGDYAGASIDPSNGALVWGTNELNGPTTSGHDAQWATQNFALVDVPPTAKALVSGKPAQGVTLGFDGSSSTDADGSVAAYSWKFGDGSTATGAKASHVYRKAGKFSATLTVTDRNGATGSTTLTIKVAKAKIVHVGRKKNNSQRFVVLKVRTNAPGTVRIGGKKKKLKKPGIVKFKVSLDGGQLAQLAAQGKLTIQIKIKFAPKFGKKSKKTVNVTFTQ